MPNLIGDVLPPGARMGKCKTLDFGMGERNWRAAEGRRGD